MRLYINVKQIGKRKPVIGQIPFEYEQQPETVRDLITMTVQICIKQYCKKRLKTDTPVPLSSEDMENQATVGKIAFGFAFNSKEPDMDKAVDTAITAFEDGLYRVFIEETECEGLDTELTVSEGQTLTFIRLTMLAGRM